MSIKSSWKRHFPNSYERAWQLWERFWKLDYRLYELRSQMNGYERERKRVENAVGYYPNIDNPRTLNEKILWKKINNRNPLIIKTSDKIRVREYVRDKLENEAEDIIIPILETSEEPSTLSLSAYETPYVIKANHGWNTNLFVEEQKSENEFVASTEDTSTSRWSRSDIERECRKWLNTTHGFEDHQWGYLNIDRKLFVEPFLSDEYGVRLTEIKIDCFHGEPKFILLIVNRDEERLHTLVDAEGQKLKVQYKGTEDVSEEVLSDFRSVLPELRKWAARLSEEFEYCRVDFYLTPDGPRFSEITHYPASGTRKMKPQEFELEMGRHWNIDSE